MSAVTVIPDFSALAVQLSSLKGVEVFGGVLLSEKTTWRIGGPAALWVEIDPDSDYRNLEDVVDLCHAHAAPFAVIGGGSNILAPDEGYPGVVIKLVSRDRAPVFDKRGVHVDAALTLSSVVKESVQRGWSDLEFLGGIPGTVGGAVAMNAGSAAVWIDSVIEEVTVLRYRGDAIDDRPYVTTLQRDDVEWGYRTSSLRDTAIILSALIRLETRGESDEIQARLKERHAIRKETQPLSCLQAGSVFRNPDGDSAGRLIEAVGLKGRESGGAQFSDVHANFIINKGDATADDVLALIKLAEQRVFEEYGIRLQKEVRLLGSET